MPKMFWKPPFSKGLDFNYIHDTYLSSKWYKITNFQKQNKENNKINITRPA